MSPSAQISGPALPTAHKPLCTSPYTPFRLVREFVSILPCYLKVATIEAPFSIGKRRSRAVVLSARLLPTAWLPRFLAGNSKPEPYSPLYGHLTISKWPQLRLKSRPDPRLLICIRRLINRRLQSRLR